MTSMMRRRSLGGAEASASDIARSSSPSLGAPASALSRWNARPGEALLADEASHVIAPITSSAAATARAQRRTSAPFRAHLDAVAGLAAREPVAERQIERALASVLRAACVEGIALK